MQTTNRWQVGNATVTRVIESEAGAFPPGFMFTGLTEERVRSIKWLHPHYATEDGNIRFSLHTYVIESDGKTIVVDTCMGNDKDRAFEGWNRQSLPFLEWLADAGFPADSIDIVLCTHLHTDHVGWNTRWDGTHWIPTFPNARYLFGRKEWEHWSQQPPELGDMPAEIAQAASVEVAIADSVTPIVEAGLHELVDSDHQLTSEVSLRPTPGHSPGHVSVAIRSAGARAVITGDVVLNPIQLADPDILSNFDYDREVARTTRRTFIENHTDQDALVLGTHFATPAVGYIVSDGDAWRFKALDASSEPRPITPARS